MGGWTGLWKEDGCLVERRVGGLMLLHASRKNVIARVELSGAYMTVLGNVCQRQPKSLQNWKDGCVPEPQCFKFHGWNEAWRELMLLHASWKGC